METTVKRRRLRSPEECVALSKFQLAGTAVAAASVVIITIMLSLAWRVMIS